MMHKMINGVEYATELEKPVSRAMAEELKKKDLTEWKGYVKQYPKYASFKFSARIVPAGKSFGKDSFWEFTNNTVSNLNNFERCIELREPASTCKGTMKVKKGETVPISLAMYPIKNIKVRLEDPNLTFTVLDAAYRNVLPRIDASNFRVVEADLFVYPNDKFPTLRFLVSNIQDMNKFYAMSRDYHPVSPVEYYVVIKE